MKWLKFCWFNIFQTINLKQKKHSNRLQIFYCENVKAINTKNIFVKWLAMTGLHEKLILYKVT